MKETDFYQSGTRALVFDGAEWSKVGDVGDNSRFWKPARIVKRYRHSGGEDVVDVIFDGRTDVSHAHFVYGLRPIDEASPAAA